MDLESAVPFDPPAGRGPEGPRSTGDMVVLPGVGNALWEAVRSRGFRKVALQVPGGLTRGARDLADRLRAETGAEVILVARACFGACDFPGPDEVPGAEASIVLGHAPIPNVPLPLPTFFVEMRSPAADPEALIETLVQGAVPRRLGLQVSVQHADLREPLRDAAARRGLSLVAGTGDRRLFYSAQALGCNYTAAESLQDRVDAFLFVGTGRFHPLGLALAVDRPVWSLDPIRNQLEPPIDRSALLRRRLALIATTRAARRWGVLVSTFAGQNRSPTAAALLRKARDRGLDAETLTFGRLDPSDLVGRDFDAYVNTACPRIALDDSELYPQPVLTPPEFLMAIGERPMSEYRFDTYH
jgi:2-(3-amino-3-carboxypropyl)histidine synthase